MINYVFEKRHAHLHRAAQRPAGLCPRQVSPPTRGKLAENLLHDPGGHQAPNVCSLLQPTKELFHFSYQRYLENQIRETFQLDAPHPASSSGSVGTTKQTPKSDGLLGPSLLMPTPFKQQEK